MNGEPRNNKVKNVQITTDNHINAGMFGFIKNGNPITINDSTVDNVTLTNENKNLLYNIDHRADDETRLIEYNPTMAGVVAVAEKDIAINNAIVKPVDYVLISLKPFDTKEALTVTMKNEDSFEIKVTDSSYTGSDETDQVLDF